MLGFSTRETPMNEMLGTFPNSYGYRADGKTYHTREESKSEKYAGTYGSGDIIGCGLLPATAEVFFTRNGKYLGIAFKNVPITTRQ